MSKPLALLAFVLGLLVLGWVGATYIGVSPFALAMTLLIAAVYLAGGVELVRFHRATGGLLTALAARPAGAAGLEVWLAPLDPALRPAVRQRIEGERLALPGPAMAPFLAGLLVLLGMLGTFLGMVATLKGAVLALDSTTDLASLRAALSAPVQGLGVAFGTSVAGVASSAMLGLVAALCRRERLKAAQVLDARIATDLRVHTQAHQREAVLETLQRQSAAMPELVTQLQATMNRMAQQHEALGQGLLEGQARFHAHAQAAYTELARSVEVSLKDSLGEAARAAGAAIQPAVEATMQGLAHESSQVRQQLVESVHTQLDGLASRFDDTVTAVAATWTTSLAEQRRQGELLTTGLGGALEQVVGRFRADSTAWLQTADRAHTARLAEAQAADAQRLAAWSGSLEAMAATLQQGWQQAGAEAQERQVRICQTLEQTGRALQAQADAGARATQAELVRLIDTAAEAPRAAAELVGQLRDKLSDSLVRDNALIEERTRTLATLASLLDTVSHAATEQRGAIDALVSTSAGLLERAGAQLGERLGAESERMGAAAVQLNASAVEVASLGEAFGVAVQLFSQSSEALTGQLQRIEAALAQAGARSDEQLGYYVAQAREVIDLSISSQKQIVDELQRLAERPASAGALA